MKLKIISAFILLISCVVMYRYKSYLLLFQLPNVTTVKKDCTRFIIGGEPTKAATNKAKWKSVGAYLLEFGVNINDEMSLRQPYTENSGYFLAHLKGVLGYRIVDNTLLKLYNSNGSSVALEMFSCRNPFSQFTDLEVLNLLGDKNDTKVGKTIAMIQVLAGRQFEDPKILELENYRGLPLWLVQTISEKFPMEVVTSPYNLPNLKYLKFEFLSKRIDQGKYGWNTPAHFLATNPHRLTTEIAQALLKPEVLAIKDSQGQTVKELLTEKGYFTKIDK